MDMFKSFHQVGVTVLIATHDVELLGNMPLRIFDAQSWRAGSMSVWLSHHWHASALALKRLAACANR